MLVMQCLTKWVVYIPNFTKFYTMHWGRYSSNKIRNKQNEHLIIVCQNFVVFTFDSKINNFEWKSERNSKMMTKVTKKQTLESK